MCCLEGRETLDTDLLTSVILALRECCSCGTCKDESALFVYNVVLVFYRGTLRTATVCSFRQAGANYHYATQGCIRPRGVVLAPVERWFGRSSRPAPQPVAPRPGRVHRASLSTVSSKTAQVLHADPIIRGCSIADLCVAMMLHCDAAISA